MDRPISRRDFIHGIGALSAASIFPMSVLAGQKGNNLRYSGEIYPPALTGMRGNHAGAFEVAHQLAREGRADWGSVQEPDAQVYDLVVVGGGISGLSAAHLAASDKY